MYYVAVDFEAPFVDNRGTEERRYCPERLEEEGRKLIEIHGNLFGEGNLSLAAFGFQRQIFCNIVLSGKLIWMQTHPIPQNVTAFEFKLVGFLTLKQFLYLAAAGIISFVIFVSGSSILRFFIIAPVALIGLALAFVPINGMSFDKWVVVFIRAITSPSRRIWSKEPKIFSFLEPQFASYLRRPVQKQSVQSTDRSRLESYLEKLRTEKKTNKLDAVERTRLSSLNFREVFQQNKEPGERRPKQTEATSAFAPSLSPERRDQ
ncbi:MAG: PrgI family protein [Candidatus Woykebacteria bacterium]